MVTDCEHYYSCRNPVQTCNAKCKRLKCKDREFGTYGVIFKCVQVNAKFTRYGWKIDESYNYFSDNELEYIGGKFD